MGCASCKFALPNQQVLLEGMTDRRVENGPGCVCVPCCWSGALREVATLEPTQYLTVEDGLSGELRNVVGPGMAWLGPYEKVIRRRTVLALKLNEYLKIVDSVTGRIRVVRGEASVVLDPLEEVLENDAQPGDERYDEDAAAGGGANRDRNRPNGRRPQRTRAAVGGTFEKIEPRRAIEIDDEVAVVVRNIQTGQLELVTDRGLFFPSADQEIVRLTRRVILEEHETMVLIDEHGRYVFKHGERAEDSSFFISPYHQVLEFNWTRFRDARNEPNGAEMGDNDECEHEQLTRIDRRRKFASYAFVVRTNDNIEMRINVWFQYEIASVEKMAKSSDDAPGDMVAHARSVILTAVAKASFEEFIRDFNDIIAEAIHNSSEDEFYLERGLLVHSIEVTSISCKNEATERILNAIIEETAERIRKKQLVASETEYAVSQTLGEVERETAFGKVLEVRHEHHRREARMRGEAEADQVRAFLQGLEGEVSNNVKGELFTILRKVDMLKQLGGSNATLYFTPNEVDLTIETKRVTSDALPAPQQKQHHNRTKANSGNENSTGRGAAGATLGTRAQRE